MLIKGGSRVYAVILLAALEACKGGGSDPAATSAAPAAPGDANAVAADAQQLIDAIAASLQADGIDPAQVNTIKSQATASYQQHPTSLRLSDAGVNSDLIAGFYLQALSSTLKASGVVHVNAVVTATVTYSKDKSFADHISTLLDTVASHIAAFGATSADVDTAVQKTVDALASGIANLPASARADAVKILGKSLAAAAAKAGAEGALSAMAQGLYGHAVIGADDGLISAATTSFALGSDAGALQGLLSGIAKAFAARPDSHAKIAASVKIAVDALAADKKSDGAAAATKGAISAVQSDGVAEMIKQIAVALAGNSAEVVNKALNAADAAGKARHDLGNDAEASLLAAENDAISAAVATNSALANQLNAPGDTAVAAQAPASPAPAPDPTSTSEQTPSAPVTLASLQLTLSTSTIGAQTATKMTVNKVMSDASVVPLDDLSQLTISFADVMGAATSNILACGDRLVVHAMGFAPVNYVIQVALKADPSKSTTASLTFDPSVGGMALPDTAVVSCLSANGGDPTTLSILPGNTSSPFTYITVYQNAVVNSTAPANASYEFVDVNGQDVPMELLSFTPASTLAMLGFPGGFPVPANLSASSLTAGSTYDLYIKVGGVRLSPTPLKIVVGPTPTLTGVVDTNTPGPNPGIWTID